MNPPWTLHYVFAWSSSLRSGPRIGARVSEKLGETESAFTSVKAGALMSRCCPHLQALFIHGKPFYSPQECSSFIPPGVYIPPQACVREALRRFANQITSMEQEHPDSLLIILGDFNRANLSHELHEYRQYIKFPTGDRNTLSHSIKGCLPLSPPCSF